MIEFIDSCCELYETLSGKDLKPAASPYVDGSLTDSDWDTRGSLSAEASRILMKMLCARDCQDLISTKLSRISHVDVD